MRRHSAETDPAAIRFNLLSMKVLHPVKQGCFYEPTLFTFQLRFTRRNGHRKR